MADTYYNLDLSGSDIERLLKLIDTDNVDEFLTAISTNTNFDAIEIIRILNLIQSGNDSLVIDK